ncbi:MAG: 50S ribosomal protein L29 [Candidatus Dasytiphilus stammeri]
MKRILEKKLNIVELQKQLLKLKKEKLKLRMESVYSSKIQSSLLTKIRKKIANIKRLLAEGKRNVSS